MKKLAIQLVLFLILVSGALIPVSAQQIYGNEDAQRGNTAESNSQPSNSGVLPVSVALLKSFPVSLSYNASGIKPDQSSGIVGLGWSLQAGGEVTRSVHGLRDERANMRPQGVTAAQYQAWNTCTVTSSRWVIQQMLADMRDNNLDTAPDEFRYDIIGRSGVFYFKPDGSILADRKIKVKVFTNKLNTFQNNSHDYVNSENHELIDGIVITFEDGVECSFKYREISAHRYVPRPNGQPISAYAEAQSINTWKITKITYPDNQTPITFEYDAPVTRPSQYVSSDFMAEHTAQGNYTYTLLNASSGTLTTYAINVKTIRGPGYKIGFSYNSATGFLEGISSYSASGNYLDGYKLYYTQLSATKTLLNRIEQVNTSFTPTKTNGSYRLEYNSNQPPEYSYFPYQDFFASRASTLDNPYYNYSLDIPAPITNTAGVDYWGFYNGVKPAYQTLIGEYTSTTLTPARQHSITGLSRANRAPNPAVSQSLILQKINYPTGGFVQYVYENNDYSYLGGDGTTPSLNYKAVAGGLRIKQIIRGDGITAGIVTKTYDYSSADNASLSSGVLENEPLYDEWFTATYNGNLACNSTSSLTLRTPFSIVPIGISYARIKETNGDGSFSVYDYNTPAVYFDGLHGEASVSHAYIMNGCDVDVEVNGFNANAYHNFIYIPGELTTMRGLLQKKEEYSVEGNLIKRTTYTFTEQEVGGILSYEQDYKPTKPDYGSGPSSSSGCYCNKGNFLAANYYHYLDWYFCRIYTRKIYFPVLEQVVERSYNQSPATGYREAKVTYTFNPDNYKYSRITKVDNAEMLAPGTGVTSVDEYYYPTDYTGVTMATTLRDANRLTEVLEHRVYRNGKIIAGELNEYGVLSGNIEKNYQLLIEAPLPASSLPFNPNSFLSNSQYYKLQGEIVYNQDAKRAEMVKPKSSLPVQTLYGHNGTLPIATVVGPNLTSARSASSAIWSYSGGLTPNQTLATISLDHAVELNLEVCFEAVSFSPMTLYVESIATGQRVFSEFFLSHTEGACSAGTGMGRIKPFTVSLSAGQYRILATGGNATITVNTSECQSNSFYTGFEDYGAAQVINGGKTGSKSWQGPYSLNLPNTQGAYVLSYWQSSTPANAQSWTYVQSSVNITSSNAATSLSFNTANNAVDEVRLYPVGAIISTQAYQEGRGTTHSMGHNSIQQVAEYDEFGRIKLVKDNNLDIIQANQYKIGTP